jgi:predicted metal-binding membrane protein
VANPQGEGRVAIVTKLIAEQPRLAAFLFGVSALGWALMLAMPHRHDFLALFVMWAAMMVGMMIPPEALSVLRLRRSFVAATLLLTGFLLPWVLYSFAAAALQSWLQERGLVDHLSMSLTNPWFAAAMLGIAGALQLSPLKRACLLRCRAPIMTPNIFLAGLRRGALSVGSCGVLMLALFAIGVMSLPAMALLTLLLLVEHWAERSTWASTAAGIALLAAGLVEVF